MYYRYLKKKILPPGLILLLLLFLIFNAAFAQEKNNLIGLSFGASNFHVTDDHTSPLIFSGTGIAPSVNWQHTGIRNSHYAEGSFYYDKLYTSSDNFITENFRGRFRYSFLHKTSDSLPVTNRVEFYFGGSVTSFYCKSDYYFDMRTIRARSIASWYWSHSIDMALQLNYFFSERNYIGLQIFSPLISNVSRPPYSPSGNYDYVKNDWVVNTFGRMVLFPRNFSVNTNMVYQHPVSAKLNIRINWEFYYMKYSDPDYISMYMNNFRIGIFYLLSKES
jgi:hypothetical protein